jgi:ABC-type transport system substrate-binding protein
MDFVVVSVPLFFYEAASSIPIVPKHIWSQVKDPSTYDDDPPISSGPLRVTEYKEGQYIVLEPVTRGGRPYTVTRTETQTLTSTVTKTTTVTEVIRETTFLSTKTVTATTEIVKGMPEAQVYTIGAGLLAIGAILGYLLARKRR